MLKDFIRDPYRAWWRDDAPKDGRLGAPEVHSLIDIEAIGAEIQGLYDIIYPDKTVYGRKTAGWFAEQLDRITLIINEGVIRAVEAYQWSPVVVALMNDTENLAGQGCCGQLEFDGDTTPPPYEMIRSLFMQFALERTNKTAREWIYPQCEELEGCNLFQYKERVPNGFGASGGDQPGPNNTFRMCDSGSCSTPDDPYWLTWDPGTNNGTYQWELWEALPPRLCHSDSSPKIIDTRGVGNRSERIYSGTDMPLISTGAGNDYVMAGIGCDDPPGRGDDPFFVFLGEGNDYFRNGEGTAHIWGEEGDDMFSNSYWGGATFDGGPGNDWIGIGSSGRGNSVNQIAVAGTGDDVIDQRGGRVETRYSLFGGSGNDRVSGCHGASFVDLGSGDDYYDGAGSSVVMGGTGNDEMNCKGGGMQIFFGGEGDDSLTGCTRGRCTHAFMILFGGPGNDHLESGSGNIFAGGEGHDTIKINGAKNVVVLEPGVDSTTSIEWKKGTDLAGLKFDVSEFGFTSYEEVMAAGLNAIQVGDEFIEFTLTGLGGHVTVSLNQFLSHGRHWVKEEDFSSDKFIYSGQVWLMQGQATTSSMMLSSDGPA